MSKKNEVVETDENDPILLELIEAQVMRLVKKHMRTHLWYCGAVIMGITTEEIYLWWPYPRLGSEGSCAEYICSSVFMQNLDRIEGSLDRMIEEIDVIPLHSPDYRFRGMFYGFDPKEKKK